MVPAFLACQATGTRLVIPSSRPSWWSGCWDRRSAGVLMAAVQKEAPVAFPEHLGLSRSTQAGMRSLCKGGVVQFGQEQCGARPSYQVSRRSVRAVGSNCIMRSRHRDPAARSGSQKAGRLGRRG